jgi:predicted nucleic acid-binding protein
MVSLDASFLIDLLAGEGDAVAKGLELDQSREPRFVAPPAAAEVMVGAHVLGGPYLVRTRLLVDNLPVLPFDRFAYNEAGRLGAELLKRGIALGASDLFVAAITLRHGERLLTRDRSFSRVPGLLVETY